MRAVVQRVRSASVAVNQERVGEIEHGLLVFVGVEQGDHGQDAEYLAGKIGGMRIFSDADGKMNLSVIETGGSVLLISQFTLCGDCRKGRRPAFTDAAHPVLAKELYEMLGAMLRKLGLVVETGVFAADMQVQLLNDGPVTLLLDSRKKF